MSKSTIILVGVLILCVIAGGVAIAFKKGVFDELLGSGTAASGPDSSGFGVPAGGQAGSPAAPAGDFGAPAGLGSDTGQAGAPAGGDFGAPAAGDFGAPAGGDFGAPAGSPASGPAGAQGSAAPAAGSQAGGRQMAPPVSPDSFRPPERQSQTVQADPLATLALNDPMSMQGGEIDRIMREMELLNYRDQLRERQLAILQKDAQIAQARHQIEQTDSPAATVDQAARSAEVEAEKRRQTAIASVRVGAIMMAPTGDKQAVVTVSNTTSYWVVGGVYSGLKVTGITINGVSAVDEKGKNYYFPVGAAASTESSSSENGGR